MISVIVPCPVSILSHPFKLQFSIKFSICIDLYNKKASFPVDKKTLTEVHNGWSILEYVRTKKRLDGDLKDVDNINVEEFKKEIKQLFSKFKVG